MFAYRLAVIRSKEKSTAIAVTGCEMSRGPHCLDNRLMDGG
jgi:hypothetical protein